MSKYKLITFDMDGTLLDSKKHISEGNAKAIADAVAAGKEVALCSGRSYPELEIFFDQIPGVRYLIFVSGAIVYDIEKKKYIYSNLMEKKWFDKLLEISRMEDVMIQPLGLSADMEREAVENISRYKMDAYYESYQTVMNLVDDFDEYYKKTQGEYAKFNFYHTDAEARERTKQRIREAGIPVEMVHAEETSLECNTIGTTKGFGLQKLCEYLGITTDEVISVGDADNDLQVLQTAGMAVAVGNANENVLKIADHVVADNDHDGCAEAIYKYLLAD